MSDTTEIQARGYIEAYPNDWPATTHIRELLAVIDGLRDDQADLQRTFDLMWAADQRAIKLWQEANPGNDLVWPDRSKLTGWLLGEIAVLKAELENSLKRLSR
jgi:hypothetical protein